METEASEELDYGTTGDRDHEDREATLQARRRALQEPGSTRDHEARARTKIGAKPSSVPLTNRKGCPEPTH